MDNLEELEKLNGLKEKGVISEAEFNEQKAALLAQPQYGSKSQLCYVLLAFFFGALGIHNFYAGRWKRGLAQLLITLLTFFIGAIFTGLWAVINIFRIHTDGKGEEFEPCKVAKYICGILGILNYLWGVITIGGVLAVGGIAGYTSAMNRYNANEILSYAAQAQILAAASNGGQGIQEIQYCENLLPSSEKIKPYLLNCLVAPDRRVQMTIGDEYIKKTILRIVKDRVQETQNGDLILSFY